MRHNSPQHTCQRKETPDNHQEVHLIHHYNIWILKKQAETTREAISPARYRRPYFTQALPFSRNPVVKLYLLLNKRSGKFRFKRSKMAGFCEIAPQKVRIGRFWGALFSTKSAISPQKAQNFAQKLGFWRPFWILSQETCFLFVQDDDFAKRRTKRPLNVV